MATDQPDNDLPAAEQSPEKAAPEQAARATAPRVHRAWQKTSGAPEAKRTQAASKKRKTIFILLACILALLGVIGAWLFFIHPFHPPELLALALTEYRPDLYPVNAFADRDSRALLSHFEAGIDGRDSQEKRLLEQRLAALRKIADRPVVVYLSGFARLRNGALYLLPSDAQPSDPPTWTSLEDVLAPLRECNAPGKLLILDITRSLDDPRRGTLPDDIAGPFANLYKSRDQRGLLVLCACAPGQAALVSEELSQSVFGYYLDQGLRGFADGYNEDHKRDGRVSVRELAAFVRARVDRWARENRGLHQTPELLGEAPDFDLVSLEQGDPTPMQEREPLDPYPSRIQEGWKTRDAWLAKGAYEYAPRAVHELELYLLRQEQRWRGHGGTDEIQRDVQAKLGELTKEVAEARPPQPAELHSLFLKAARGVVEPNADVAKELRAALEDVTGETKADIIAKRKADFAAKIGKMKPAPSSEQMSWTAFQVLLSDDNPWMEQAQLQLLLSLLLAGQPAPELVDLVFLQRLAAFAPEDKKWPKDRVRQMLQLYSEGEKAQACSPRELPWVRHALEAAMARRLDAEKLFFAGDPDTFERVSELASAASQNYKDIAAHLKAVRDAQRSRDEALRLLPSYLPCLVAQYRAASARGLQSAWSDALLVARALDDALAKPPGDKKPGAEEMDEQRETLIRLAGTLNRALRESPLRAPLKPIDVAEVMKVEGPEDRGPAVLRTVHALLDVSSILGTPWPTARQRTLLWKTSGRLADDLNAKVSALDDRDNKDQRRTKPPDDGAEKSASRLEGERAFRAGLSIRLLKLAGLAGDKLTPLEALLAKAHGAKADPKTWDALAAGLGAAWSDQLPAELLALMKQQDLTAADRASRVIHPLFGNKEALKSNPAARLRQAEAQRYWALLGGYYRKNAQSLADQPALQKVFQDAAREFMGSAE